ncbi:MAG: Rv3654c family TadE-like protein [Microbacteriaceae bacterium]
MNIKTERPWGEKSSLYQPGRRAERGSATVLSIGIVVLIVSLLSALLILVQALSHSSRMQGLVDTAALAAADAARGIIPAAPCALAAEILAQETPQSFECYQDEYQVRVVLQSNILGFVISFAALAGPP